jgi:hypothetical protein
MSNQAVEGIVLQITTDQGEDIALFGFANEADNSTNNYSSELKKLADLNAQRMANFRAEVGI